jgi:hypothetical protein
MKTATKIIKTAIAAATLALFSNASPAMAQTAPDYGLMTNLRAIASGFGDQYGQISWTNAAGQTETFAHGRQTYTVYTAGSVVYPDTLVVCTVDPAAGLSSCAPLDLSAGGGGTEGECFDDPDDGDPHCICTQPLECLLMWVADCASDLECTDDFCVCDY